VQNLGLAVVTIAAGIIVDSSGGSHFWLQIFFMFFLLSKAKLQSYNPYNKPYFIFIVSLLATCAIWAYNRKHQGNLNMSPAQRATYHTSMYVNIESS